MRDTESLLFLIVFITVQAAQELPSPPRILEHPKSLSVKKGAPATLNCAAEGNPRPQITWLKDGKPAIHSEAAHRLVLPTGLFILSTRQGKRDSDAGIYQCIASNTHGKVVSQNATLTIAVLREEFKQEPKDISVFSGGRAELKCSPPKGNPHPKISWIRNSHEIDFKQEKDRVILSQDGSIIIKEVLQTDEGEYSCKAFNPAGERTSKPAILNVIVPPFWVKAPRNVEGVSGSSAEISCRVGGDPMPKVTWTRLGGRMPVERASVIRGKGLRISPLHTEDAGVYVCEAVNPAASITANASMIVYTSPQVVEVPGDIEVEERSLLELECGVAGDPTPLIYWTREGSQGVLKSSVSPFFQSDSLPGVLAVYSVSNAARHNSGKYVCGAVNPAGGVMTRVVVRVRPSHLLPPPIISIPPSDQVLPINSHAIFTCRVWGEPEPLVSWSYNGDSIRTGNRFKIHSDNTLTIEEIKPEDEGRYSCKATSLRGSNKATAFLKVITNLNNSKIQKPIDINKIPGPPQTPSLVHINSTSATIRWNKPNRKGASPIQGYIVEYYSSSEGFWKTVDSTIKTTYYNFYPLDPLQTYGVVVRAVNNYGTSEPSGIVEIGEDIDEKFKTSENIISRLQAAQVILKEASITSSTSAKILWQMEGETSAVEGFYIRMHHVPIGLQFENRHVYFEEHRNRHKSLALQRRLPVNEGSESIYLSVGNFSVVTVLNAGPGSSSSYVLHGLLHYHSYTVFLVPFYGTVEGRPSNSKGFYTPESVPSDSPQNIAMHLTNVTTASVMWSPPPYTSRNGRIMSYQFQIMSDEGEIFLSKMFSGNVTSAMVHNLTLGHSYHLTIAAVTEAGTGPYSRPVSLHVDPVLLHPMAKSGPSLVSLDGDVWVIGMIGAAVFCILLLSIAFLLLWRKHSRNKTLGHLGGQKSENLNGTSDSCLWQDYSGWHLEKCGTGVLCHPTSNGTDKVINAAGTEGDLTIPRSMITFYRGAANSEGPYATTSLLLPHNSSIHHTAKSEESKESLNKKDEANFFSSENAATLHLLKSNRGIFGAPPLPCLPPPGLPTEQRGQTPCYCSSKGPYSTAESAYSEAHYAPSIRPFIKDQKDCPPMYHPSHCSQHIYASATPLPPYPESTSSRPSVTSSPAMHHHLCRNSAVYESASVQYAPTGYFLPSSITSSGQGSPGDRNNSAPSLPSVTFEALKALSQDIEAFRQMQKLKDESEIITKEKRSSSEVSSCDKPSQSFYKESKSCDNIDSTPNKSKSSKTTSSGSMTAPLVESESDFAPLVEGESDFCDEKCSECSCSCSESSVYADAEFTDEVRQALQEPGLLCHSLRKHKHRQRPVSDCSNDIVVSSDLICNKETKQFMNNKLLPKQSDV